MSDHESSSSSNESLSLTPPSAVKRPPSPMSEEEVIEPPSFSLATLGLQRVGTVAPPRPKPPAQPPLQMLNARGMPARIRKRNRFFFDENIINDDKPLRMSLSPRRPPVKIVAPIAHSSPVKTPTKVLKKRKGVASRYMRVGEDKKKAESPRTPSKTRPRLGSTVTTPKSNKKLSSASRSQPETSKPVDTPSKADKKCGQRVGLRLRNLLKLPKAHKWVIHEWFYSFVDRPLYATTADYLQFLRTNFRGLQTTKMTRGDWRIVRFLMGKPRRCSQAFFDEERRELERKRQKIRFMQTRKSGEIKDVNYVRDLPDKVPLPLPIGTRVTARLRVPQDGVFNGTVDAFDSATSTYRVSFERPGLGTHSVPDYEILSENFFEMLPVQSITKDFRPSYAHLYQNSAGGGHSASKSGLRQVRTALNMNLSKCDPLLAQEVIDSPVRNSFLQRDIINGYPAKMLEAVVRLKCALKIKRAKMDRLCDMNNDAEMKVTQHTHEHRDGSVFHFDSDFQRRYASVVISLEKMNHDMLDYLELVQRSSAEITRDPQMQAMLKPSFLREKCRETADESVKRNNHENVKHPKTLGIIQRLATLLMVASHLSPEDQTGQVHKILEGCIEETKASLFERNLETFKQCVSVHLHHISLGVSQKKCD